MGAAVRIADDEGKLPVGVDHRHALPAPRALRVPHQRLHPRKRHRVAPPTVQPASEQAVEL